MKIFVCVNTLTKIDSLAYSNHCQFWYRLGKEFPEDKFIFYTPNRASIDRARNQSAKIALEQECDYLLFLDDDVLVPTDGLKLLLKSDADIAAGWTIIRGYPFNNMFFKFDENQEHLNYYNDFTLNEAGLIECDAVGFSFCLIKCSLLKKVPPPFFVTGLNNTEDIYFCLKAREVDSNCSIIVDPKVKTGHQLGSEYMDPDNREAYKKFYEEIYKPASDEHPRDRGQDYLNMVKEVVK